MLEAMLRFRERVGAWCAALALVGGAVFLWNAPEEVVRELPRHREIAVGVGVFGLVFVLALTLRGQAGYRARALLLLLLAVGAGGGIAWWLQDAARDVWALKQHGAHRDVTVVGSSMKQNPKTKTVTHLARVRIDGEIRSVALGRTPRRGETVRVLVAPGRPGALVPGSVAREWLPLIREKIGGWMALLLGFFLLFCLLSIPVNLWHVLAGAPAGTDPDADRP